jgi:hypothetical protein
MAPARSLWTWPERWLVEERTSASLGLGLFSFDQIYPNLPRGSATRGGRFSIRSQYAC